MVAGNARQGGDVQHAGGSSAGLGSPEAAASGPAAAALAAKRRREKLSAEKERKRARAFALNATLQERRDEPEEDTEPDPEDREVPENVSDDEEDDTFPRVALPPLKNSLGKWHDSFVARSAPGIAPSVTPHEGAAGEAVFTPTPIRRYNTRQNTQGGRSAAVEPGDMMAGHRMVNVGQLRGLLGHLPCNDSGGAPGQPHVPVQRGQVLGEATYAATPPRASSHKGNSGTSLADRRGSLPRQSTRAHGRPGQRNRRRGGRVGGRRRRRP